MKLLIVAIGSAGDVHPFLAIGQAAARRGHRVSVCTSPAFRGLVEVCGLRFLPLGTEDDYRRAMADPRLWDTRTSFKTLWQLVAQTLDPLYELLQAEVDADTVVLGSLWAFAARAFQQKFGLPFLSAQVSPSTLLSAWHPPEHGRFVLSERLPLAIKWPVVRLAERVLVDRVMAPALDAFLRRLGLAPARRILGRWMHSPDGVLALFPSWFAPAQPDWPQPLSFTGFPLFELPGGAGGDEDLAQFLADGPAPVVVTAGSTRLSGSGWFTAVLGALAALGQRTVVLGGEPGQRPPLPAGMLHRSFVPLLPLLERSSAIVHHGGIGTTACALAAGVPQLVTPFAHDQFDNARRVVAVGAGLRLKAQASSADVQAALARLLPDDALRLRCAALQRRTQTDSAQAACDRAVDQAEACLARRAAVSAPTGLSLVGQRA